MKEKEKATSRVWQLGAMNWHSLLIWQHLSSSKKSKKYFEQTKFYRIYRDDGFVAFDGIIDFWAVKIWLQNFQRNINQITGGNFLQFTIELWKPGEMDKKTGEKCLKIKQKEFSFLDMNLLKSRNAKLSFRAYAKPGQKIVYVEKGSAHRRSCLRAIPSGVFNRLGRLT